MSPYPTLALPGRPRRAAVSGTNGLFRLDYFNGRLADATALRGEQAWLDTRFDLPSLGRGEGIVWGLAVEAPGIGAVPARTDGLRGGLEPKSTVVVLRRGVAVDGQGTPFGVGGDTPFRCVELFNAFHAGPARLSTGVAQPYGVTTASASTGLFPGAYVLLARPAEADEGTLPVRAGGCGPADARCGVDGVREGLSVSLAYVEPFPTDVRSALATISTGAARLSYLRNAAVTRFFDLWERNLPARWSRTLPADPAGVAPAGPPMRGTNPVVLALLLVGDDGTLLAVEPWVGRRPVYAPQGSAWAAARLGAPVPPQAFTRWQQFQTQLAEAVAGRTLGPTSTPSLRSLGFRVLPPFGFLPVGAQASVDVASVRASAVRWFGDAAVLVHTITAVHDDAILPDLRDAMDADPLLLPPPLGARSGYGMDLASLQKLAMTWPTESRDQLWPYLEQMAAQQGQTTRAGITFEEIAARRVELVRVYVLLEGARRLWPIVGTQSLLAFGGTDAADAARPVAFYVRVRLALPAETKWPLRYQAPAAAARPPGG